MKIENCLHIGQRIKERREELSMTQEELSKKLGYRSRSTINKIEMGKNDIPQSKIELFAKALNIPPIALMGWDDTEKDIKLKDKKTHDIHSKKILLELEKEISDMVDDDIVKLIDYAKHIKSNY